MPTSFSFYINRCTDDAYLEQLEDMKRACNEMVETCRKEYHAKPDGKEREFAGIMLTNLLEENAVCNAFYDFVQQCYKSAESHTEAKALITKYINASAKLRTADETIKFWSKAK
jgi:hypothetical protein